MQCTWIISRPSLSPPALWKKHLPWNWSLVPKWLGTTAPQHPKQDLIYNRHCLVSQLSCSVVSDSLWCHGLRHTRLPCPSPTPRACSTHVHRVGDAIQPSHPLSFSCLPAFNLSQQHGLYNESVLRIRWPKYWSFSFSICPSHEYSGLFSFRID